MPITEQLMDIGSFEVDLDPATPTSVLNDISIKTRLWATYVHTPDHWEIGDLSDATLLSLARYCGRVLGQPKDRLGVDGVHIADWLGRDGAGGNLYSGADISTAGLDLEAHLDNIIFTASNGITKGNINSTATTFTHKREGGDTRREMLDTLARMAPGGPYFWRLNSHDFTLDVDTLATLWGSPTVILAEEGGREGAIVSLYAIIDVDDLDGSEVKSGGRVDWNDGVDVGASNATLPSTYGNLVGGSPVDLIYLDSRPKRPKPPTEKWRQVAPWAIASEARAISMAAAEVNERSVIREEITATLPDLDDPWRYDITPGNTVYLDDLDRGLSNTANEVYYRGEAAHPTTGRVEEMTAPLNGGGHYLRCWDGSSTFEWIDITRHVVPEDGPVVLGINRRSRYPVSARARRLTRAERRGWYQRAHTAARLQRYLERVEQGRHQR